MLLQILYHLNWITLYKQYHYLNILIGYLLSVLEHFYALIKYVHIIAGAIVLLASDPHHVATFLLVVVGVTAGHLLIAMVIEIHHMAMGM